MNLREAAAGLWRAMRLKSARPSLLDTYESIRVEQSDRADLELLLGPSRTKYYLARHQGGQTVEFLTDPTTGKVVAKKLLSPAVDDRGVRGGDLRFSGTVRLIRQLRAASAGRPPGSAARLHSPGNPRTLLEWFAGSAVPRLLGRAGPGDRYFVNGRPIHARAYHTLLESHDGDDLVVELRTGLPGA